MVSMGPDTLGSVKALQLDQDMNRKLPATRLGLMPDV